MLRFVDRGQKICNNNFFYLFWLKQSIQAYLVKHIHHIIVYKTNINILKPNVVSKCSREVVKFPILSLCHKFSLHLRRKIFFIIHVGWYRYICKTAKFFKQNITKTARKYISQYVYISIQNVSLYQALRYVVYF